MPAKIFISYRRDDASAYAGWLYDTLKKRFPEEQLFKDIDSIPLGKDFKKIIENQVKECLIVLVVIGKKFTKVTDEKGVVRISKKDDFVNIELSKALRSKKIIIPVLVENAEMPSINELPTNLHKLPFLNGITLRPESWSRDSHKLIEELSKIINDIEQEEEAKLKRKQEEEKKAKEEAELKRKQEQELKAKEEAENKRKLEEEQKAKEQAENKRKLEEERKAEEQAENKRKLEEERKAKELAESKRKLEEERKAKEQAENKRKLEEERKAKEQAELNHKQDEERKAIEEAELKRKEEEEHKAKEEAENKRKLEEEQKAKEQAESKRKQEEEQKAKEESERKRKLEEERKAKEQAENNRKLEEERKAKEKEQTKSTLQPDEILQQKQLGKEAASQKQKTLLIIFSIVTISIIVILIWQPWKNRGSDSVEEAQMINTNEVKSNEDSTAWAQVQKVGTEDLYDKYLREFPDGSHANEAKAKIEKIVFNNCSTVEDYKNYLVKYPDGMFVDQASQNITQLINDANLAADNEAWTEAQKAGTNNSYNKYLREFTDGYHAKEAKAKIEEIVFNNSSTIDDYKNYLAKYPNGKYKNQAENKIFQLETNIIWDDNKERGHFIDPRDQVKYKVVKIGNQIWMAENLKAIKYSDNNAIQLVTDPTELSELKTPGYCWYNNDEAANKNTYGALYNWYAVNTGKLCATGWHVPTDDEWKQLEMNLGMSQSEADGVGRRGADEGKKLKSTTGWNEGGNGTDEAGFKALPGGFRISGNFGTLGYYVNWWSATEYKPRRAWYRSLDYESDIVYRNYNHKNENGFSVRCVRD